MPQTVEFTFHTTAGEIVRGHRFINPDDTVGGWVADSAVIAPGSFVELDAIVGPSAEVGPGRIVRNGTFLQEGEKY
ncbi:hypothetical protein [Labrenzia sp. VG12]|uniref:hypothetical protein n=1 Tax=Labrenzia sp. VG12 TaxID=2021862 RepID=UPI0012FD3FC7|nr:hypothetical protein [Labrenzia sp. VG12]